MLNGKEQRKIELVVEKATQGERENLKKDAEETLSRYAETVNFKYLDSNEANELYSAVEILVRLECLEKGKGWWYRAKRRPQIMKSIF
jgi:hypothetical protein